jgi:cell shape-determining protein MreC
MTLNNRLRQSKIRGLEITNNTHLATIKLIDDKIDALIQSKSRYYIYIDNNKNKIEELKEQINQQEQNESLETQT